MSLNVYVFILFTFPPTLTLKLHTALAGKVIKLSDVVIRFSDIFISRKKQLFFFFPLFWSDIRVSCSRVSLHQFALDAQREASHRYSAEQHQLRLISSLIHWLLLLISQSVGSVCWKQTLVTVTRDSNLEHEHVVVAWAAGWSPAPPSGSLM